VSYLTESCDFLGRVLLRRDCVCRADLTPIGFNFRSLQQIHPFLEPSGSGISSLWARTTALKYNTNVLVGYPEKVDVRAKWPTGPEYYNSAIMVNDDGETVFNYRKNFLDRVDQHWALESCDGFIECDMPGIGKVCVGLGVDLKYACPLATMTTLVSDSLAAPIARTLPGMHSTLLSTPWKSRQMSSLYACRG
jgi:predicted amidohydrolase